MPSVAVKLYSVFFKLLLKHRLQGWLDGGAAAATAGTFGVTSRPEESTAAVNPSFGPDGVATKDIHIDPFTSLSIRIFLPDTSLPRPKPHPTARSLDPPRRNSYGGATASPAPDHASRRTSLDAPGSVVENGGGSYGGYLPSVAGDGRHRSGGTRKLPVILQFHGGGFIAGSNASAANDFFCRRIAKLCDVIVIAVGYRLAPENRYPAAFEDGLEVLNWLGKQANLAECSKSLGSAKGGGDGDSKRADIVDTFGASSVEPWLAAHADPSRYFFLFRRCIFYPLSLMFPFIFC